MCHNCRKKFIQTRTNHIFCSSNCRKSYDRLVETFCNKGNINIEEFKSNPLLGHKLVSSKIYLLKKKYKNKSEIAAMNAINEQNKEFKKNSKCCTKCKIRKPFSDFQQKTKRLSNLCNSCNEENRIVSNEKTRQRGIKNRAYNTERKRLWRIEKRENNPKKYYEKVCVGCQNNYTTPISKQKYCSSKCARDSELPHSRLKHKKERELLPDTYIASQLATQLHTKVSEIYEYPHLITVQRNLITLNRLIKNGNKT